MRPALLALIALLLAADAPAVAGDRPASSVVEITRASDGHLGAGVHIAAGLILTAAHVVRDDETVIVEDSRHRRQAGRVIAVDMGRDLALVLPEQPGRLAVSALACLLPPPGLAVTVTGHPMGEPFVAVATRVAGPPEPVAGWPDLVLLSSRALPGMSGGPVIAGDGSVVALVVAAIDMPGVVYGPAGAVPAPEICRYLAGLVCEGYQCGGRSAGLPPARAVSLRRLVADGGG